MHTAKCDKCPRQFTKSTILSAEQALRMHYNRKHGNNQGSPELRAIYGAKTSKLRYTPDAEPLPKRKYTKRAKAPDTREAIINFCPKCGCDLHKIAVGMVLAESVKQR